MIHSILDISKYRDTVKYRYRTFTSIAILRYIEYRTSTSSTLTLSLTLNAPSAKIISLQVDVGQYSNETDLPHDTDVPYVIRIINYLRVIPPYHILKTRIPPTQMITDDLKFI